MPIYQYVHSGAPLSILERDRLAKEIVRIHHSVTNAPEPFVRVVFQAVPLGMIYTAGEIAPSVILNCQIRAGRTQEQRQEILRRCYELITDVTKLAPDQIVINVGETPGPDIMEAGLILPEPNDEDEAQWVATLQETYPGRYDDWGVHGKLTPEGETVPTTHAAEFGKIAHEVAQMAKREATPSR
jgi:phenylpyruvate tautomerase PptA (4-oxalocrotonate tautomerase family)